MDNNHNTFSDSGLRRNYSLESRDMGFVLAHILDWVSFGFNLIGCDMLIPKTLINHQPLLYVGIRAPPKVHNGRWMKIWVFYSVQIFVKVVFLLGTHLEAHVLPQYSCAFYLLDTFCKALNCFVKILSSHHLIIFPIFRLVSVMAYVCLCMSMFYALLNRVYILYLHMTYFSKMY